MEENKRPDCFVPADNSEKTVYRCAADLVAMAKAQKMSLDGVKKIVNMAWHVSDALETVKTVLKNLGAKSE